MYYKNEDYIVKTEVICGEDKYFIKFLGQVNEPEVEVPIDFLNLYLIEFAKPLRKQKNAASRHLEDRDFDILMESKEVSGKINSFEEHSISKIEIAQALKTCTPIQQRRFELYYEQGLSLKEISEIERVSLAAVQKSISSAEEKIKNFYEG